MFKSLLTASAVLAMATPALASKARMASLQNAASLTSDTYSIFDNPSRAYLTGDFMTLEMGATSVAATGANTPENIVTNGGNSAALYAPNAEGGFVKSYGDNKVGFYLGKKSPFTSQLRAMTGFAGQENPFEILYGFQAADMKMGVSFNYSKSEPKTAGSQQKQDAMGLRFGATAENWNAGLLFGLGSNATGNAAAAGTIATTAGDASKYKGTMGFKVSGGYNMDSMYIYGSYYQDGAKVENLNVGLALDAEVGQSQYEIGVIDTMKAEGMSFFYGASYVGFKSEAKKINQAALEGTVKDVFNHTQTQLPFIIGVEADAASWLTLRASAKQNVILGSSKSYDSTLTPPGDGDSVTLTNNTTVALGAGMKFNKFTLDSSLEAGSVPADVGNGVINANNLMANASLTYLF